jgi:SAM-dependent methyltransferase
VDFVKDHKPDLVWDLNKPERMPFEDNSFDEVQMYETIEHLGALGDFQTLLWQFEEYWRLLKPGGLFCATTPMWNSMWAFGDPGHRRIVNLGTLVFLSQAEYQKQVGVTPMTDYRPWYSGDFDVVQAGQQAETFVFVLRAIKPSRKVKE